MTALQLLKLRSEIETILARLEGLESTYGLRLEVYFRESQSYRPPKVDIEVRLPKPTKAAPQP